MRSFSPSFIALIFAHIGYFIFAHERILGEKNPSRSLSRTFLLPNSLSAGGRVGGGSRSMRRRTRTGRRNWLSLLFWGGGGLSNSCFSRLLSPPFNFLSGQSTQERRDLYIFIRI